MENLAELEMSRIRNELWVYFPLVILDFVFYDRRVLNPICEADPLTAKRSLFVIGSTCLRLNGNGRSSVQLLSNNFGLYCFVFSRCFGGPGGFRKVQEAGRNDFLLFSLKSDSMVRSDVRKTKS